MSDFHVGDEVLAMWQNDGFVDPAVVVAVDGPNAHVAYLDGSEATLPFGALRHGTLGPGLALQANWRGGGSYYEGTITQRIGMAVYVVYADGDRGWSTLGQCRVRAEVLATIPPTTAACTYCGSPVQYGAVECGRCGAPIRRR
jgi:hypothetical protein